jgi:hypothetical protein
MIALADFRNWPLADIEMAWRDVRFWGGKADMSKPARDVC